MTPAEPTRITADRQPLIGYLGCSFLLHLGVVGLALTTPLFALVAAMFPSCHEAESRRPAMEVSIVELPKTDKKVPDRLARVKAESGSVEEPPPVKESDLVIHEDEPDPDAGNTEEQRRQQLLQEIERRRLLAEMENAPEGARDRDPTDPNGTASLEKAVLGAQAKGDPRVARWSALVRDAVQANFHPLGDFPDASCLVVFYFDPATGRVSSYEIKEPSGILSFDSAAERAAEATLTLPTGLPEEFWPWFRDEGVGARLKAKN